MERFDDFGTPNVIGVPINHAARLAFLPSAKLKIAATPLAVEEATDEDVKFGLTGGDDAPVGLGFSSERLLAKIRAHLKRLTEQR